MALYEDLEELRLSELDAAAKGDIRRHEGARLSPYLDTLGNPTIGIGHLIRPGEDFSSGISESEAEDIFDVDYATHRKSAEDVPGWDNATDSQKRGLISLNYNMGPGWWEKFPNASEAMGAGDWDRAAGEIKDSAWYGQVGPTRGDDVVSMLKPGEPSYRTLLLPTGESFKVEDGISDDKALEIAEGKWPEAFKPEGVPDGVPSRQPADPQGSRVLPLPTGEIFRVEAGISDDEAYEIAERKWPEAFKGLYTKEDTSAWDSYKASASRAFGGFIPGIQALWAGGSGQQELYAEQQKLLAAETDLAYEISGDQLSLAKITDIYDEEGLLAAADATTDYAAQTVMGSLGFMSPMIAGGGAGAVIGAGIGGIFAGVPGAIAGARIGGVTASFLSSMGTFLSENMESLYNEGGVDTKDVNVLAQLGASGTQSALNLLSYRLAGSGFAQLGRGAQKGVAASAENVLARLDRTTGLKKIVAGLGLEEVTELSQEALERLVSGAAVSPFDPEAANQYMEVAFGTLFPGTLFGSVGAGTAKLNEINQRKFEKGFLKTKKERIRARREAEKLEADDRALKIEDEAARIEAERAEEALAIEGRNLSAGWARAATEEGARLSVEAGRTAREAELIAQGRITIEDIHAILKDRNIAWDNDPGFQSFTKRLTGEFHLDDLARKGKQAELNKLYERIAAMPVQDSLTRLQLATDDIAIDIASKIGKGIVTDAKLGKHLLLGTEISDENKAEIFEAYRRRLLDLGVASLDEKNNVVMKSGRSPVSLDIYDQIISDMRANGKFPEFFQFGKYGIRSRKLYDDILGYAITRGDVKRDGNKVIPAVPTVPTVPTVTTESVSDPREGVVEKYNYTISDEPETRWVIRDKGKVLAIEKTKSAAEAKRIKLAGQGLWDFVVGSEVIASSNRKSDVNQEKKKYTDGVRREEVDRARTRLRREFSTVHPYGLSESQIEKMAKAQGAAAARIRIRELKVEVVQKPIPKPVKRVGFAVNETRTYENGRVRKNIPVSISRDRKAAENVRARLEERRVGRESWAGKVSGPRKVETISEIQRMRADPAGVAAEELPSPAPLRALEPEVAPVLDPAREVALREYPSLQEEFSQEEKTRADKLGEEMTKYVNAKRLTDLRVNFVKSLSDPSSFDDSRNLIEISLTRELVEADLKDAVRIVAPLVDGEAIHHLRMMGAFNKKEWSALERYVSRKIDPESESGSTFLDQSKDQSPELGSSELVENAVARAVQVWGRNRGVASGQTEGLMNRIVTFFRSLGKGIRDAGFTNAEGVFESLYGDKYGSRVRAGKVYGDYFSVEKGWSNPRVEAQELAALAVDKARVAELNKSIKDRLLDRTKLSLSRRYKFDDPVSDNAMEPVGREYGFSPIGNKNVRVMVPEGHSESDSRGFGKAALDRGDSVIGERGGPYSDWRELLDGFFRELGNRDKSSPKTITRSKDDDGGRISYIWSHPDFKDYPVNIVLDLDEETGSYIVVAARPSKKFLQPSGSKRAASGQSIHGPDTSSEAVAAYNGDGEPFTPSQQAAAGLNESNAIQTSGQKAVTDEINPKSNNDGRTLGQKLSNWKWWPGAGNSVEERRDLVDKYRQRYLDQYHRVLRIEKMRATKEGRDYSDQLAHASAHAAMMMRENAGMIMQGAKGIGVPIHMAGTTFVGGFKRQLDKDKPNYNSYLDKDGNAIADDDFDSRVVDDGQEISNTAEVRYLRPGRTVTHKGKTYRNGDFITIDGLYEDGLTGGVETILRPVAIPTNNLLDQVFQFMRAVIAERYNAEGKKTPLNPTEIEQGLRLIEDNPEILVVVENYHRWNSGLVDFGVQSGYISKEAGEVYKRHGDYIPFFTLTDGFTTPAADAASVDLDALVFGVRPGVGSVDRLKKYKGHEKDLMASADAIAKNSFAIIESSLITIAKNRALDDAVAIGWARKIDTPSEDEKGSSTFTYENGEKVWYHVTDQLLLEVLTGSLEGQHPYTGWLSAPARWTRELVTRGPSFMIANMLRDSLSVWITNQGDFTPITGTFARFGKNLRGMHWSKDNETTKTYKDLRRHGVIGRYERSRTGKGRGGSDPFGGDSNLNDDQFLKFSDKAVPYAGAMTKLWEKLGEVSAFSESATREKVYESTYTKTYNRLIGAGESEQTSRLQAEAEGAHQANEILNFSRHGNNPWLRLITSIVPFMNARLQGIDQIGRNAGGFTALREDQSAVRAAMLWRGLLIAGASGMLAALNYDDDDYKNMPSYVQDDYFLIPLFNSSVPFIGIPIPFEAGVIFKLFPELFVKRLLGANDNKQTIESVIRAITITLNFNPLQAPVLKVGIEPMTNYNMFTRRNIVPWHMEGMGGDATRVSTGAIAQHVGGAMDVSPLILDNAAKTILPGIASIMYGFVNQMVRAASPSLPSLPAKRWTEYPVAKRFFKDEFEGGLREEIFSVETAGRNITNRINAIKERDPMRAVEMQMENSGLLSVYPAVKDIRKKMREIKDRKDAIIGSNMDRARKQTMVDQLSRSENLLLRNADVIRRMADLDASWTDLF